MDFQKIILVGKVISKPQIEKTEEGVLDVIRFKISVSHFTENDVVFPIVSIVLLNENRDIEIIKGSTVLVEGILDLDKSGKYIVRADYYHSMDSDKNSAKEQKLLF